MYAKSLTAEETLKIIWDSLGTTESVDGRVLENVQAQCCPSSNPYRHFKSKEIDN